MIKTNQIQNIAATHTVNVADIGNWNPTGITLDETTTPKLSEIPLTGVTAATKFPDGTIAGTDGTGKFVMFPCGLLSRETGRWK